ncbi:helix-turn-helix domain-containing protein [Devosia sediminis]|uniref:helix-turn-helix domain-containing protein n=1 Tax=Devosia sediminis TaxID=2798801 RepID=UPI001F3BAE54
MLKRVDARVSDVARRVGYASEGAFSRAFKAQFGHAPVMARKWSGWGGSDSLPSRTRFLAKKASI